MKMFPTQKLWLLLLVAKCLLISPSMSMNKEEETNWQDEDPKDIVDADVGVNKNPAADGTVDVVTSTGNDNKPTDDGAVLFDAEGGPGTNPPGDGKGDVGVVGTNDTREKFNDLTDMQSGLNGWDFGGMWSKWDSSEMEEEHRQVPTNPAKDDQFVFICHPQRFPCYLRKQYEALEEVNFTISYFASINQSLNMKGVVEQPIRSEPTEIFDMTYPEDLHEQNKQWVAQEFHLGNFTTAFTIKLTITGDSESMWATDELELDGYKPKNLPIVNTEAPKPGNNATIITTLAPNVNASKPVVPSNVTVNASATTTESSNVTVITGNATTDNKTKGNSTESVGSGNSTTEATGINNTSGGNSGQSSSLQESNSTVSPASPFTTEPSRNNSKDKTSTPEVQFPGNPQANASSSPGYTATKAPGVNVTEVTSNKSIDDPSGSSTENPGIVTVYVPPGTPGNPPDHTVGTPPKYATDEGYGIDKYVSKLAGVAQAIWDAFYVFLALFCACLVAIVALIVRGRCKSPAETTTAPRQPSPPTTPGPPPTASTRSMTTEDTRPTPFERSV